MAKKKEVLTIEEKLEKAIVPDWERPYKVPSNWVWTRLDKICKYIKAGGDKPKNITLSKTTDNQIPVIANGISDFGIVGYTNISTAEPQTITVSARGTIGVSVFREYHYYPIVRLITIKPSNNVNGIFLKYLFDNFLEEGTGSSIPQLTVPMIKNKDIPLPPLAEQKRIVERIESLFSKLDEAKELAKSALDSFEERKSAILHKAFTGELTKKWREENGIGFDSWDEKAFEDIVKPVKDKFDPNTENLILKYIGLEHIEKNNGISGCGNSEDLKSLKTKFRTGDILYGKLRPYLNKHDITSFDGVCSTDILVFRTSNLETSKFINFFMNTSYFIDYAVSNSKGINLPRVSEKDLKIFKIKLPNHNEQKEIVRILESIFEKETKAKELANVIEQIDLMKKSILARAFRGELGTNNPSDESAIGLLKEILEEK